MNLNLQIGQRIVDGSMPKTFDAMNFILTYRELFPQDYGADLMSFDGSADPIQALNSQIGAWLADNAAALKIAKDPQKREAVNQKGFVGEVSRWHKN